MNDDKNKYYTLEINYEGGERGEIYIRLDEFGKPEKILSSLKHLECAVKKIGLREYMLGVEKIAKGE